jgi:uncharacterized protein (TIGR02328 family)
MRLWHKDLIGVLPRKQLLGQWRECCCIAKAIQENQTPNHILVNKIMDYPLSHLYTYGGIVANHMVRRGYRCDFDRFKKYFPEKDQIPIRFNDLFREWHNKRYLTQCYYNLEEKYDCGGISEEEWERIREKCVLELFW